MQNKTVLDQALEINNEYYRKLPTDALLIVYEDFDRKIIKCCELGLINACSSLMLAMKSINETLFERGIIQ